MILKPLTRKSDALGDTCMDATSALERFITRRERLLMRFDEVRAALDVWIAAHRSVGIPITELAHFEGLLGERRSILQQLMELDDEMLDTVLLLQTGMTRADPTVVS
jgi:hypothetical protein